MAKNKRTKIEIPNTYDITERVKRTRNKIENTPFKSVTEMNKASEEIQRALWFRLENARILKAMMETENFNFIKEELREGLSCKYGTNQADLVRVFSEGTGIQIAINPSIVNEIEKSELFVEALIRSTADSFSKSYYQIKGMLPVETSDNHDPIAKVKNK